VIIASPTALLSLASNLQQIHTFVVSNRVHFHHRSNRLNENGPTSLVSMKLLSLTTFNSTGDRLNNIQFGCVIGKRRVLLDCNPLARACLDGQVGKLPDLI
jgi:hypothetical protein